MVKKVCISLFLSLIGITQAIAGNPEPHWQQSGQASWYDQNAGEKTASGQRFDPRGMTAAHRTLPLGSVVEVIDDTTGKSVVVTINDRGPYKIVRNRILPHPTRVIDLSRGAAKRLGLISGCKTRNCERGITTIRLVVLSVPQNHHS